MLFKILQKIGQGSAAPCAGFMFIDDARAFLKMKQEKAQGVQYELWEGNTQLQGTISSEQAEKVHSFRPTPFPMSFKPHSAPHGFIRPREDAEEDT